MATALGIVVVVTVLAWLADAHARRTAWRNIAAARQACAVERAESSASHLELCPRCHLDFTVVDDRRFPDST